MQKIIALMTTVLVLTAATAQAEHKLLITEVLNAGQIEAQATFEYARAQMSITDKATGDRGRAIQNRTESFYSLGLGLGHGFEVTASIPYVFSERGKEEVGPAVAFEKRDGFGDFSLGGKYSILEEKHAPVSLVAGMDIKFDSAGGKDNPGSGTTDFSPYLAVSKNLGHHLTPYAGYRATISNHDAPDTHTLTLGVEKELNHTVTLDARFDAAFATATKEVSSMESYSLEIASYLQVCHNVYLIPSIALATGSTAHSKVVDVSSGSPFGVKGALALYYLF